MKKSKKILLLALVLTLGFSFCGAFGKNASAAKKTTEVAYTFYSYVAEGGSPLTIERSITITGDKALVQCGKEIHFKNASGKDDVRNDPKIVITTDYETKQSSDFTIVSNPPYNVLKHCETEVPKVKKALEDNGVTVVSAGLLWINYTDPSSSNRHLLVDGSEAEVACQESGNVHTVYIVTGPSSYVSFTQTGGSCAGVEDVYKSKLAEAGFKTSWWDETPETWPSTLVALGVYPSRYTPPVQEGGGEEPGK
ncbi:MAG: hypothetical protein Q4A33_02965, partial [Candidatus Saccharibacteria bacterium]|nr:hypothetical protein [Candidatus Saccharibacteria bacterium]